MSSKTKTDLRLANDETISVDTYATAVPGLVVHREHRYSPSKKSHRATSKWTVSHQQSGQSLLLPSQMLETKMEAMALAERLEDIEWSKAREELDTHDVWSKVQTAYKEINNENFSADLDRSRHGVDELAEQANYDGVYGMRTEGRGRSREYVIFNKETDEEVERHTLPGKATDRLAELNNGEDA